MFMVVKEGARKARATAGVANADAIVPGRVCPYAELGVAANTPVGRHAGRAAE